MEFGAAPAREQGGLVHIESQAGLSCEYRNDTSVPNSCPT